MTGKSVLVTGGAGYIGSHTVRLLHAEGYRVVVLDNLIHGHREAVVDDVAEFVEGAVGDRALLKTLFEKYHFDGVVHFAAFAYVGESVQEPLKYYRNNTAEPLTLLEIMKEHGCQSFVFSSTCATYGEPEVLPLTEDQPQKPLSPYGRSKLMMEWILQDCGEAWGLRSAALRYFNASGCSGDGLIGEDHDPETHLIPLVLMVAKGEIPQLTVFGTDYPTDDGTCIRDYIHVEDLASAHLLALGKMIAGQTSLQCNLGTGVGISVQEIIDLAEEITGRKIPIQYGARRPGDPARLVADPSRARTLLGWEARHKGARTMIETAWRWMSQTHGGHFPS